MVSHFCHVHTAVGDVGVTPLLVLTTFSVTTLGARYLTSSASVSGRSSFRPTSNSLSRAGTDTPSCFAFFLKKMHTSTCVRTHTHMHTFFESHECAFSLGFLCRPLYYLPVTPIFKYSFFPLFILIFCYIPFLFIHFSSGNLSASEVIPLA